MIIFFDRTTSPETDPVARLAIMTLPGIDSPLEQHSLLPRQDYDGAWSHYIIPIMVRERIIMAMAAALKDKQDWERKVFDEAIVNKWKDEALRSTGNNSQDGENPGEGGRHDAEVRSHPPELDFGIDRQEVVTDKLFDYVSQNAQFA